MTTSSPALTPLPVVERRKPGPAPAPKPRSFLFINKDAESEVLSRSSGRVATSINSHVQRWQDKKGARTKSQGKAQTLQQPGSKAPTYKECVIKFRPKPRKRAEKNAPKQQLPPPFKREHSDSSSSGPTTAYNTTPEPLKEPPEGDGVLEVIKRDSSRPREDVIYSANFSGPDCIDPFQSAYAHYPGVQPILEYYISFTMDSTFQSDAAAKGAKKEPLHFPAIRRIVQGSLTHRMHMYALLAATAARMKRVSGVTLPPESSPEFLLQNAIHYVQKRFAPGTGSPSADDRQDILDVFYLCVCLWYEKDYDAARSHLAFVRYLWNSLRPSDSLFDKYIHDMITYNDVFLAIETRTPPLFELTWEPENSPAERVQEVEDETDNPSISPSQSPGSTSTSTHSPLSVSTSSSYSTKLSTTPSIATGFITLTTSNSLQLPDSLIGILKDLIPLIRTAHDHLPPLAPLPPAETQYASLKTQALLHKLLSFQPLTTTPASSIILTLIILLSCMSTSPAWRAGKLEMSDLSHRLRSTLSLLPHQSTPYPIVVDNIHYEATTFPALCPSLAGIDDSLLLWILVSGAFAAQTHAQSEQWFLDQAVQCARRIGIYDLWTLRMELMTYLYLDHLEGSTLEKLYSAIRWS
jgi:hypothetical protein